MPYKRQNNKESGLNQNPEKQLVEELDSILFEHSLKNLSFRERDRDIFFNRPLAAYLLYKVAKFTQETVPSFQDIINGKLQCCENAIYLCRQRFDEELWENISTLLTKYPADVFAKVLLIPESSEYYKGDSSKMGDFGTPPSLINLSLSLLKLTPNDVIADLCCGSGSFITDASFAAPNAKIHAYSLYVDVAAIAAMKADILGNITVSINDIFNLVAGEKDHLATGQFDKVFLHSPWGYNPHSKAYDKYCARIIDQNPGLPKHTSPEWFFSSLACDLMSSNGKAVAIMPSGRMMVSSDRLLRRHFVENGLIESIVLLPQNMFSSTSISASLVVFSHGNESVQLIDATEICHQKRRLNEFTEEDIETICQALNIDTSYSKTVSITEIAENDYSLSPQRYIIKNTYTFENGVLFGDIMKNVIRGVQMSSKHIDTLVSATDTGMQYLELKNIQDGIISDRLPYIKAINPKHQKYCLKTNSLILSKSSMPLKVAVAEVPEGRQILASGNMFIIELDESRANPYYIKSFLESEAGQAILKSITVGTTLPIIGVDELKKISIPLPSMEEQERVAAKYLAACDEVKLMRYRLERALSKLQHVMDDSAEWQNA